MWYISERIWQLYHSSVNLAHLFKEEFKNLNVKFQCFKKTNETEIWIVTLKSVWKSNWIVDLEGCDTPIESMLNHRSLSRTFASFKEHTVGAILWNYSGWSWTKGSWRAICSSERSNLDHISQEWCLSVSRVGRASGLLFRQLSRKSWQSGQRGNRMLIQTLCSVCFCVCLIPLDVCLHDLPKERLSLTRRFSWIMSVLSWKGRRLWSIPNGTTPSCHTVVGFGPVTAM